MAPYLIAPFVRVRSVFLVAAFASLAACGGGGDGGAPAPISYVGPTGSASITNDSDATTLSASSYEMGSATASGAGAAGVVQSGTTEAQIRQRALVIADKVRSLSALTEGSVSPTSVIAGSEPGLCGGTATYSVADDWSSGSITYLNYCHTGVTMAGTVNFAFDMVTPSIALVMNLDVRDDASGAIYRLQNYQVSVVDHTSYAEMTITAGSRFYHPQYGYVSVSTLQPLWINAGEYWPSAGELVITTDNTSSTHRGCRLVASSMTYTIYYDDDGIGYFDDGSITGNWADL